jgi:hypothetical protein
MKRKSAEVLHVFEYASRFEVQPDPPPTSGGAACGQ